ncbi:uncharacterized protein LOC111409254 [Olea europaea var. sylvestris]|uniref:uncharacterized protein LOC111409254 n=1 Tax=Olea europaea var. sylvestris TaxID=158386 RepID=UPI000C1D3D57|nr:uncharacterized protein LOC111409254 [Olea europaea var. sylvestris]
MSITSAEQTFESAPAENMYHQKVEKFLHNHQTESLQHDLCRRRVISAWRMDYLSAMIIAQWMLGKTVNHSQWETLERASSFNNHSGSGSSSHSTGFHHRMKEPVTASSESGISTEIDHKAIIKERDRNSVKAPLMIKSRISFCSVKANCCNIIEIN